MVIPSIFTAIDRFSSPLRGMGNAVRNFANTAEANISRAERGFRRLTPALSGATKQFLSFASAAAISAAIIAGVMFSVQSVKDYETALASLSSITGLSGDAFIPFQNKVLQVAKDTSKSAVEVAKAFEIVGSMKSDLLGNADALGAVAQAAIVLSKASRDDIAASASNLTGVMNQFNLAANQSERVINVLAAGSVVGAANITQINESMVNFGSVADGANISLEKSVALVEVMGQKSLFGAEAGTKLRGSILKLQQAGVGYASGQFDINDALAESKKKIDGLKTAKEKDMAILKLFGAENISTGKILLGNIALFDQYTKGVTGTNTANEQAAINSNTLTVAIEEVKAAWVNMIVGSGEATSALNTAKTAIKFVTDNLGTIVSIGSKVLLFLIGFKVLLVASRMAMIAYNVTLGIMGALSGSASIAIGQNAIALGSYKVVLGIVTVAQRLWNAAMLMNPIGLIILAIAALIAVVVVIIKYWNQWGAAMLSLAVFLGPVSAAFAFIISLIQSFRRNWDMIKQSFSEGGILAGFKAIGATILDAILMPLQQVFKLMSNIPLIGGMAKKAMAGIENFRAGLGVNVTTDESGNPLTKPVVDANKARQDLLTERVTSVQKQNVSIDINDKTGRASMNASNPFVPINLTSTSFAR